LGFGSDNHLGWEGVEGTERIACEGDGADVGGRRQWRSGHLHLGGEGAEYKASGAKDKQIAFIEGADHFMRAGGTKAHLGDPRPRLMKVLVDWTRELFPA